MNTNHLSDLSADDGYQPDPAADIQLLVDAFLDRIALLAREKALPAELVTAIRDRQAELESANAHRATDEASRHNLRITMLVLAGYQVLRPVLGPEESMTAARTALVEPYSAQVREGTRAMLDAAPDPFTAMVEVSRAREQHAFGPAFTFERAADDDQRYLLNVRRCFYHDLLVANSAAELTPVLCAWDTNWMEAVDPQRHGFRFDRPTTIGLGGSHCPFHFIRTAE